MTKNRGLGRGLDALFGDEESGHLPDSDSVASGAGNSRRTVPIAHVHPADDQPRTVFDDDALNELANSIRENGVIQPILVRPHRLGGEKERYEIVAGERRWRAAQRAQLHEIPVIIREMDDSTAYRIALIENLQRQDLNPLEEARGYRRLMEDYSHAADDVGKAVGKSRSHVANMTRLLNLPASVQAMVSKGEISAGHARALLSSENPALLAQAILSKGLSVRQTEALALEESGKAPRSYKGRGVVTPKKDADTLAIERDLSNALGVGVSLDMTGPQGGRLSLSFKSLDQLDGVLRRLSGGAR